MFVTHNGVIESLFFSLVAEREGRGGQPEHRYRCLSLHARVVQGAHDARVPGADDRLPAAALERESEGDARAQLLSAGGARALFLPRARRRHALANGARLDLARTGGSERDPPGIGAIRGGTRVGATRGARAALPEGETRHPDARAQPDRTRRQRRVNRRATEKRICMNFYAKNATFMRVSRFSCLGDVWCFAVAFGITTERVPSTRFGHLCRRTFTTEDKSLLVLSDKSRFGDSPVSSCAQH